MAGRFVGDTAVGIAAAVQSGRATPAEVLEEHLERIAALDPRLEGLPAGQGREGQGRGEGPG